MENKLKLEHIAAYLTYGLKCHNMGNSDDKGIPIVQEIIGLDLDGVLVSFEHEDEHYIFSDTLPILRPLSDLTKEIDVNGEKFVPINKFNRESRQQLEKELSITNANLICDFLNYEIIKKLISWHFDIHGLIEQGLAIDINTLKK